MTRHARLVLLGMVGVLPLLRGAAVHAAQAAPPGTRTGPALPDGDGGLVGLAAGEVAVIRQARQIARGLVQSPHEPSWIRNEAAAALKRLHEALNDWGRPGQLEWYLERILHEPDPGVRRTLVGGAMAAAKARQPHLGGVRALWRTLDALAEEDPKLLAKDIDYDRRYVADTETALRPLGTLVPRQLRPYHLPTPQLDLSALVPYPEPKE